MYVKALQICFSSSLSDWNFSKVKIPKIVINRILNFKFWFPFTSENLFLDSRFTPLGKSQKTMWRFLWWKKCLFLVVVTLPSRVHSVPVPVPLIPLPLMVRSLKNVFMRVVNFTCLLHGKAYWTRTNYITQYLSRTGIRKKGNFDVSGKEGYTNGF